MPTMFCKRWILNIILNKKKNTNNISLIVILQSIRPNHWSSYNIWLTLLMVLNIQEDDKTRI